MIEMDEFDIDLSLFDEEKDVFNISDKMNVEQLLQQQEEKDEEEMIQSFISSPSSTATSIDSYDECRRSCKRKIYHAVGECKYHRTHPGYKNYAILTCKQCKLAMNACNLDGCPCGGRGMIIKTESTHTVLHTINHNPPRYVGIRTNRLGSSLKLAQKWLQSS